MSSRPKYHSCQGGAKEERVVSEGNSGRKQPKSGFDRWVVQYTERLLGLRWAVILASLLLVIACAMGAPRLGISTDYRDWFSQQNPQLQAFEELQRVYSQDDNVSFVIKPSSGDVFTRPLLSDIRDLTEAAWKLPYARRVNSITNFQHSYAEGDDLTVEDLIRNPESMTQADIDRVREIAMNDPLLLDQTLSRDGTTTSVNVTVAIPGKDPRENSEIIEAANELAADFRARHPDTRVALTGVVPLNNAFYQTGVDDSATLLPAMYGFLLLAMVLLLRSITGTVATLIVIGLSTTAAMGIAGWMGIKLTPVSFNAPTIILTLAIADSIHLLVTIAKEMRNGATKRDAVVESMRINFGPIFLTSVTTIIGFLSLNFSDAPPFRDFGNITAMGVAAAWLFSVTFLPALISLLPMRASQREDRLTRRMNALAEAIIARPRTVFFGMAAVAIALIALVPRIELNDQFVRYFDTSLEFRVDSDFASANLPGIYQANWSLPADGSGAISDPDYQRKVEAFGDWLREQPEVSHVSTLTDIFKRLNKNMHGDDPAYYRLADERNLAAQYLLLFELSLPYGLDLNNQINVDKSAMRTIVTLHDITTAQLRDFQARARGWLDVNFPEVPPSADATGAFKMFAYISERNINGMLLGTFIAFLLISLSLLIALRSIKIGFLSLVPNLIPAAMAFGIWSIVVGQVGLASAVVVATSLGIVVDATVHFLSKYLRARRERRNSAEDAVRYAFSTVGTALWVVSAILVVGFGILSLSAFRVNSDMGLLTAIAILAALATDFLLLPALLLLVDGKSARRRRPQEAPIPAE